MSYKNTAITPCESAAGKLELSRPRARLVLFNSDNPRAKIHSLFAVSLIFVFCATAIIFVMLQTVPPLQSVVLGTKNGEDEYSMRQF